MQREKGARLERELVNLFREAGLTAERVPLSGAAGGSYVGDLTVEGLRAEVKGRSGANGFALIERWLGDHDLLLCRRDRGPWLAVLPVERLIALLKALREDDHGLDPMIGVAL